MSVVSLGNITAETDHDMLDKAFFETPDYKTITESANRSIIVGRRGTGKSALNYRLKNYWKKAEKNYVIQISPDETQVIGLREIINYFGEKFLHIKAGTKLMWRYAIYLEVALWFYKHYKYSKQLNTEGILDHILYWEKERGSFTAKIRKRLIALIDKNDSPQTIIANLGDKFDLELLEENLKNILEDTGVTFNILVDKVDEGYSPDTQGIALVDGFVQTIIDINNYFPSALNSYIFIRDNIYRAIAKTDPDFTRNIESHILRLHWSEYNLFNLVCNRIRIAFGISTENNRKLWNTFTADELQNSEGFRTCLRLTLYRPRDILVLLNHAFDHAASENRKKLILADINHSSSSVSRNRLNDLHKEYESIFPSIDIFTNKLSGGRATLQFDEIASSVREVLAKDNYPPWKQQDIALIESCTSVVQRLYSVGFLGIKEGGKENFIFCHDGRAPSKEISKEDVFLVHPCYWLALNLSDRTLDLSQAEDIYDEYDIEITSVSEDQRSARIEQLLQAFNQIEPGTKGAHDFEEWCFNAVRVLFAGSLTNIELHPNTNGLQQRDIVATNQSETDIWKRIYSDYKTRQVVFEIKNFDSLEQEHFRQINSYLCKSYGNLGFIICRSMNNNLSKKELGWINELYHNHTKLIIKLSDRFLLKYLRKQRSPQKHNEINREMTKLLDLYLRKYLSLKAK